MTRKIKETISVTTNGITIYVKIDFKANRFDIVELTGNQAFSSQFTKKEFVFIGRNRAYLNGWINICEAIQNAIKEASRLYDEWKENEDKEHVEFMAKVCLDK